MTHHQVSPSLTFALNTFLKFWAANYVHLNFHNMRLQTHHKNQKKPLSLFDAELNPSCSSHLSSSVSQQHDSREGQTFSAVKHFFPHLNFLFFTYKPEDTTLHRSERSVLHSKKGENRVKWHIMSACYDSLHETGHSVNFKGSYSAQMNRKKTYILQLIMIHCLPIRQLCGNHGALSLTILQVGSSTLQKKRYFRL